MITLTQVDIDQIIEIFAAHKIAVTINCSQVNYFGKIKINAEKVNVMLLTSHLHYHPNLIIKQLGVAMVAYLVPKFHPRMTLEQALPTAFNAVIANIYKVTPENPHEHKVVRFAEDYDGQIMDEYVCPLSDFFTADEEINEDELDNIAFENMRESLNCGVIVGDEDMDVDDREITHDTKVTFYIKTDMLEKTQEFTAGYLGFSPAMQKEKFLDRLDEYMRDWRNEHCEAGWEITEPFVLV